MKYLLIFLYTVLASSFAFADDQSTVPDLPHLTHHAASSVSTSPTQPSAPAHEQAMIQRLNEEFTLEMEIREALINVQNQLASTQKALEDMTKERDALKPKTEQPSPQPSPPLQKPN
jgi:hypothetical protein